jgi:hypothetical protein
MTGQKPAASAVPQDEILSHTDLRIVPEGYEIPESTSPLDHHDLRIIEVLSEQKPD